MVTVIAAGLSPVLQRGQVVLGRGRGGYTRAPMNPLDPTFVGAMVWILPASEGVRAAPE